MRKTLLAIVLFAIASTSMAQNNEQNRQRIERAQNRNLSYNAVKRERVARNTENDTIKFPNGRWFFGVGGGAHYYMGDHNRQAKIRDVIAPKLDIYAGHWINRLWGVRFEYSGLKEKGLTNPHGQNAVNPSNKEGDTGGMYHGANPYGTGIEYRCKNGDYLERQSFKFFNLHTDVMFNMTQLIYPDENDADYILDVIPYLGIGWAHVMEKKPCNSLSYNLGIYSTLRINGHMSVNLDVHSMIVRDNFDKDPGERKGEGALGLALGLNYHF